MTDDGQPDGLNPESRLLYADLHRAAEELAYLNAPVECRTSQYGLKALKLMFGGRPPPSTPFREAFLQASRNLDLISGLRVIVDPELPENRIEFRDQDGKVTFSMDLP
jgi:hypothetical protein